MTLNPQQRIPDNLDTMLPSGRTVRGIVNERAERARLAALEIPDDLGPALNEQAAKFHLLRRMFSPDGR